MTTFRISGQIIDLHTHQGLFAVRVEAWDKDLICSDLVGSAVTDSQGVFQITFDESYFQELFGDRRPDLFFRVFRGDKLIKNTEDSVLWNLSSENIQIIIEIEENHQMNSHINFTVGVSFEGVTSDKQPPPTSVYAFDANGKFLTSAPVANNQSILSLPTATAGQVVRFVVGPRLEGETPKLAQLTRLEAYEKRLRVNPRNPSLNLKLIDPIWIRWLLCPCVVRGRVIKRVTLPDGTVKELPICHARVTICEVDAWPIILLRLPDDILWRLRDELLNLIRAPTPIPPRPIPEAAVQDVSPYPAPFGSNVRGLLAPSSLADLASATATGSALQPIELQLTDVVVQSRILPIARIGSVIQLRQELVNLADIIRPYLCLWPWLHPFFYRIDCLSPINVDEDGRFETTIFYWCFGDKPDLYFTVEQLQGGVWQTIYKPSIPCHTYWNYACGSEVVINITDPSAIACVPDDPTEPPSGVVTWIMPFAVGGTKIWGTPPSAAAEPAGWVKSDGKTDYTDSISGLSFVNAPFGGSLGFRHSYSSNINGDAAGPTKINNIQYYRWSYRKAASGQWKQMDIPVFKYYVKQKPAQLPSFPVYKLGPNTVGANTNLFQFRPSAPPLPDPTDPTGTITEWPTDSSLGDIYSAFLNSLALSPSVAGAAGQYQIKLEIFDTAGNLVIPGAGTFQFILPTGVAGDGTIYTRSVQPSELDVDAGGFVFNLHIDNNSCTATIDPPKIAGTAAADVCGFLRYDPATPTPVTVSFHARHPNNFAEFSFQIVRGATDLVVARASGQEVDAGIAGPYKGDEVGNFTNNFNCSDLLCGTNDVNHPVDPNNCCVNAAFAEYLYVYAKATTGWGSRIAADDASAFRAFALAAKS